jgi:hypothetical protein
MTEPDEIFRREDLKREIREILEQTIDARVERYLEVAHQGIIPNHHFAKASSECIDLYRDDYLLSTVMVSQSVAEGVWHFVLERNGTQPDRDRPAIAAALVERRIISSECAEAFGRIWRSFRNDVHHMNPGVSAVPIQELAKRNWIDLAAIEREIFAVTFSAGKIVPVQPRYWDLRPDGTTSVFLRDPWIAGKPAAAPDGRR